MPVVFGETGETYDDSECTSANMKVILPWADRPQRGYAAWTWDAWGSCPSLIFWHGGTPNSTSPAGTAYALYARNHMLSMNARPPIVPVSPRPAPPSGS